MYVFIHLKIYLFEGVWIHLCYLLGMIFLDKRSLRRADKRYCLTCIIKKAECRRIDTLELWCWRSPSESLGLQGDQTNQSKRKPTLIIHWKDWCWSWSSNILATRCKELTHWKRPWCWERLMAGGEGGNRGWDGWMASPTQWTWVRANSRRQWRTGKPECCSPWGCSRTQLSEWTAKCLWRGALCFFTILGNKILSWSPSDKCLSQFMYLSEKLICNKYMNWTSLS